MTSGGMTRLPRHEREKKIIRTRLISFEDLGHICCVNQKHQKLRTLGRTWRPQPGPQGSCSVNSRGCPCILWRIMTNKVMHFFITFIYWLFPITKSTLNIVFSNEYIECITKKHRVATSREGKNRASWKICVRRNLYDLQRGRRVTPFVWTL